MLVFGLAAIAIFVSRRNEQGNGIPFAGQPTRKVIPLKVTADFDWASAEESTLEEFAAALQPEEGASIAPKDARIKEFDVTLDPGESIVLEGYEREEGVFVFSRLTPTVTLSDDGVALMTIEGERFSVDVSGSSETLSVPRVMTREGYRAMISMSDGESYYQLGLTATRENDQIRLIGSESVSE